jgi:hypothetical protein
MVQIYEQLYNILLNQINIPKNANNINDSKIESTEIQDFTTNKIKREQ